MGKYRGTPSYSSYRGRTPRWKPVLAVVLVLVCLLSGAVIFMQRYLVYDESGRARLLLPWSQEPETHQEELVVPELHIEEPVPQAPKSQRLTLLPQTPLTLEAWTTVAEQFADQELLDSGVITLRFQGRVYFDAASALHDTLDLREDTTQALQTLTAAWEHPVARISCLLDPVASHIQVEALGLKNTGGYLFYDGNNHNWLDPSKPGTVELLSGLCVEAADLGFQELLLTDLTFPTLGKLNKIRYPEQPRTDAITALLNAIRTALDEAGHEDVALSLELTADALRAGGDEVAGWDLPALSEAADAFYAPCAPEDIPALTQAAQSYGETRFVPELDAPPADPAQDCFLLLP